MWITSCFFYNFVEVYASFTHESASFIQIIHAYKNSVLFYIPMFFKKWPSPLSLKCNKKLKETIYIELKK